MTTVQALTKVFQDTFKSQVKPEKQPLFQVGEVVKLKTSPNIEYKVLNSYKVNFPTDDNNKFDWWYQLERNGNTDIDWPEYSLENFFVNFPC